MPSVVQSEFRRQAIIACTDVFEGYSAVVVAAVQSRLEHRLWEVVDSAVFDIAVQSRSWHRLWEIVEVVDLGIETEVSVKSGSI